MTQPTHPRTTLASDAGKHVGSRVTVQTDGNTYTGTLNHAGETCGRWLLGINTHPRDGAVNTHMIWVEPEQEITLEAPANAGASHIGGAV